MVPGVLIEMLVRTLARIVHIVTVMFMFTILILECFFQLEKDTNLYEDAFFKRVLSISGIAMIASGVLLTAMMRRTDALPSQNKWLAYFPPKFFMSLLLTPISDKIALVLVGHRRQVTDENDNQRYMFDLSSDWKSTIRMFRLGLMAMLFIYSAMVR